MVSGFRPLADTPGVGSPDLDRPKRAGHGLSVGTVRRALSNSALVPGSAGFDDAPTGRVSVNLPSSGMHTSSQTSQLASAFSASVPEASVAGVIFASSTTSS